VNISSPRKPEPLVVPSQIYIEQDYCRELSMVSPRVLASTVQEVESLNTILGEMAGRETSAYGAAGKPDVILVVFDEKG
jgi:hypothetical protein